MSAPHHDLAGGEHHHPVRSEEDRVPVLRLIMIGLGALLIFFVGSFAAVRYLTWRQAERGPIPVPPAIGQSKIGMVEQQPFDLSLRADREKARQLRRLGAAGWVDRQAGVAHIPIEAALQLSLQGVRPPGAPSAPPSPAGGQP